MASPATVPPGSGVKLRPREVLASKHNCSWSPPHVCGPAHSHGLSCPSFPHAPFPSSSYVFAHLDTDREEGKALLCDYEGEARQP